MKWNTKIQARVLSICWLNEIELEGLLVKDIVWRDGILYAVIRERNDDESQEVDKKWIPVIAGYEQMLLDILKGRDPDENAFSGWYLFLSEKRLYSLERRYAPRLYTMLSGCVPPIDNRRPDPGEENLSLDQYNVAVVYVVAHVLRWDCDAPGYIAATYIGRRSSKRKKEENVAMRVREEAQ